MLRRHVTFIMLLVGTLLVLSFFEKPHNQNPSATISQADLPLEIQKMKTAPSFGEKEVLYKKLIERVGPTEAQEDLYHSALPFDGQTHLLNHTVGVWLYDHYKNAGLAFCKEYFLSSCQHGFLIKAVGNEGISSIKDIMIECQKKGVAVATQCAHGIGHGMLAWIGYANLPDALAYCDTFARELNNFPAYNCYDGMFMENIWAIHDDGKPSPSRWIDLSDMAYPCDDVRIAEKYKKACWSNQPNLIYQLFEKNVEQIGRICATLTNQSYKQICFDGLARQIHPLTRGSIPKTFAMCNLMPTDWQHECLFSIVKSGYNLGDRTMPYYICKEVQVTAQKKCYKTLSDAIAFNETTKKDQDVGCERIEEPVFRRDCKKAIISYR